MRARIQDNILLLIPENEEELEEVEDWLDSEDMMLGCITEEHEVVH